MILVQLHLIFTLLPTLICRLIWPQLWNFIGSQTKFNSFLVTNEHPERICLYLVREFDYEPSKIGHFQISKSIFGANCDLIFLKQKFLFEYQIRRTTFIKSIYFFDQSEKTLFSKNEPYFWQLVIKLSYKIQTNPFRMFICDHKTIEFHATHHEMPRPWSLWSPTFWKIALHHPRLSSYDQNEYSQWILGISMVRSPS